MSDELRADKRPDHWNYRHKHGGSDSITYNSWKSMIARCSRSNHKGYARYGGRGITVCQRWLGENGYANFLSDMGARPSATHSIDRISNDENYEPSNCRWATRHEQRLNASNSRRLTINGVTKTAFEWSQEPGAVNYECLIGRLYRGWPDDKAVFLPMQKAGGRGNKWSLS